jgi:hypothetical protein
MNWSALTKKQQQMVVATVVLAVVQIVLMVHFLGWTKPASARGGSAKKELLELQQKIEDANAIIRQEQSIRRNLEESVAKLEALAVHVPTLSDRYAWVYEYVSRCATQARVELDSLEETVFVDSDKKKPVSHPYEISISTRCGYNSLVEFLWRLEKDNPLLRVKDVTITTIPEQALSHQVQIVIQWPTSVKIERGAKQ